MDDINGQYFTLIYGTLDLSRLVLQYVAAGHPGPLVVNEHEARSLDTTGMPIGFMEDTVYVDTSVQLHQGDRVYFFSDGIPEALNKYEEQFGRERMERHLAQIYKNSTLRQSIDKLALATIKWRGGAALQDDISVIGVEILAPGKDTQD
jgi:sigma-B regulation protein RsbU (phosphoserine phosphatase)